MSCTGVSTSMNVLLQNLMIVMYLKEQHVQTLKGVTLVLVIHPMLEMERPVSR